jgi:hypothetical protein
VKKYLIMDGKILQGDTLFEVLEIVSPLFKENKVRHCVYIQRTLWNRMVDIAYQTQ